jgi:hypothetical protein
MQATEKAMVEASDPSVAEVMTVVDEDMAEEEDWDDEEVIVPQI